MKNIKAFQVSAFCIIIATMFSACGIMKNNDFSSQKYTHFKKGESTTNINQVTKVKRGDNLYSVVSDNSEATEIAEVSKVAASEPSQTIMTSIPEIKNESGITVYHINTIPKVKINRAASIMMNRHSIDKASTASHDDVNLILLVILSIILPPLAVFLVRGIGGAFWLDILLCIFFWLPGIIYALIVIFGA
jgi:uncharacterized membrane protein YqaE (UPF0057 family)